jgi:hypothetical protein
VSTLPTPPDEGFHEKPPRRGWHRTGPILALVGAGAIALGSLLPWATLSSIFGSISVAGTQGDGVITLIVSALIAVFGIVAMTKPQSDSASFSILVFILAAIGVGIGIYDATRIQRVVSDVPESIAAASVGIGLWLLIAGALLAAVSVFIKDTPTTPSTP